MCIPVHTVVSICRYESLRCTFESRLASLAKTVFSALENTLEDDLTRALNSSESTRVFAPAHALSLIKRHLASEGEASFHDLALKLANAEAELRLYCRRNEELSSSVCLLRGEASRDEHARIKASDVNAEIQEIRQEYQVGPLGWDYGSSCLCEIGCGRNTLTSDSPAAVVFSHVHTRYHRYVTAVECGR